MNRRYSVHRYVSRSSELHECMSLDGKWVNFGFCLSINSQTVYPTKREGGILSEYQIYFVKLKIQLSKIYHLLQLL